MEFQLLFILFLVGLCLYVLLVLWVGRQSKSPPRQAAASEKQESAAPQTTSSGSEVSTLCPINKTEETNLRNCFPWSIYYLENIEYRPQAVLCIGKLRSNPEEAYNTIRSNIEALFGERFFVLFQESISGKPFFALIPNPQYRPTGKRKMERLSQPGLALGLLLVTLFTCTLIGSAIVGVTEKQLLANPAVLLQGLPYAVPLMTILGIHELGHYLTALFYKIRTTLPYFIPVPFFLGTFGAFIQIRSPIPNRKALFDIGIAGPLAGFIVTLPILFWGLAHSSVVEISQKSGILNVDSLNPRFSLFFTLVSKLALGSGLSPNTAIHMHPVAVAGYIGLIVTALNLMPVGQLDGGHIVHAMFGQRISIFIGQITRLLVLGLGFIHRDLLVWALILLVIPLMDEPALNDVSELDNWRDLWGLLTLTLLVIILLPVPGSLIKLLHI